MPNPKAFDGYVEMLARVSSASLIHLHRNRYSVPTDAHSLGRQHLVSNLFSQRDQHSRVAYLAVNATESDH